MKTKKTLNNLCQATKIKKKYIKIFQNYQSMEGYKGMWINHWISHKVQFGQSPKREIEYGTAVNLPRPSLKSVHVRVTPKGLWGMRGDTIFVSWGGQVGPDIKNDATMCDSTWKLLFTNRPLTKRKHFLTEEQYLFVTAATMKYWLEGGEYLHKNVCFYICTTGKLSSSFDIKESFSIQVSTKS